MRPRRRLLTLPVLLSLFVACDGTATRALADCTEKNLYLTKGDVLDQIPIYDQGETLLCYAYTAAQLTEFYLRDSGQWKWGTDHIDPLWMAIAYKGGPADILHIQRNQLGYGHLHSALKDVEDMGICDPTVFHKKLREFEKDTPLQNADFLFLFEEFWDRRAKRPDESFENAMNALQDDSSFKAIADRAHKRAAVGIIARYGVCGADPLRVAPFFGEEDGTILQEVFRKELRSIYDVVHAVPEEEVRKREKIRFLRQQVFGACQGDKLLKPNFPKVKGVGLFYASNKKLSRNIDEMLDSPSPAPVGVGYCANIYEDDDALAARASQRQPLLPRIARALQIERCSPHYSMVVGRRPDPAAVAGKKKEASCQYLVRNSYGTGFWTKRYTCLCDVTPAGKAGPRSYEDCRPTGGEADKTKKVVGCWLPERDLLNATYDVSVYK